MKKIIQLIDDLDEKTLDKLIYLDRIINLHTKFLDIWNRHQIKSDGKIVYVKFFRIDKFGYESFTEREFPIEDLQIRIDGYKRKVHAEFSKRHDNLRLLRERNVYKWKKYIENAKFYLSE